MSKAVFLTQRVRAEGAGRTLRLFGLQVGDGQAWSLRVSWEDVQVWFGEAGVQAAVGRGGRRLLLLLHQQSLRQLPLVLLDLLLHVIDCACNLRGSI